MDKERCESVEVSTYEKYLDLGGRFWQEDYEVVINMLGEKRRYVPNCVETLQMQRIASYCGTEVTQEEIQIYCVLRKKLNPGTDIQKTEDPRSIPVWTMCDQELVRQIFLVTEGVNERIQVMAKKMPHIFR